MSITAGTAAILAGGSALSSLFGGLFGSSGQSAANKANLQIARETNAQNYKMFQEQLGFTESMWNKNNEYNTPEAQMARYRSAGINPYLALSNVNNGNATAAATPSSQAAVTGAPMQNEMLPLAQGISQSVNSGLSALSQVLDNEFKAVDLVTRADENLTRLSGMRKQNLISDAQYNQIVATTDQITKMLPGQLQLQASQLGLNSATQKEIAQRVELMKTQQMVLDFDLKNIKPLEVKQLSTIIWKMKQDVITGRMSANAALQQAEAALRNVKISEDNADVVRDHLRAEAELARYNAQPLNDEYEEVDVPQIAKKYKHSQYRGKSLFDPTIPSDSIPKNARVYYPKK